jgi:uncharacterized membrane protein
MEYMFIANREETTRFSTLQEAVNHAKALGYPAVFEDARQNIIVEKAYHLRGMKITGTTEDEYGDPLFNRHITTRVGEMDKKLDEVETAVGNVEWSVNTVETAVRALEEENARQSDIIADLTARIAALESMLH